MMTIHFPSWLTRFPPGYVDEFLSLSCPICEIEGTTGKTMHAKFRLHSRMSPEGVGGPTLVLNSRHSVNSAYAFTLCLAPPARPILVILYLGRLN